MQWRKRRAEVGEIDGRCGWEAVLANPWGGKNKGKLMSLSTRTGSISIAMYYAADIK